jgi:hypothetical protein
MSPSRGGCHAGAGADSSAGRDELEGGGLFPSFEDEVGEGIALAGSGLHGLHGFGEGFGGTEVAESPDSADLEGFGDFEGGADLVLVEAAHAVGVQTEGGGLEGQVGGGCAGVVQGVAVGLSGLSEGLFADGEDEDGSSGGPALVAVDESVKEFGVGGVAFLADEEAPGLLVVAGSGPGGGGEDFGEIFAGDGLVGKGAGAPALEEEVFDAGFGGGVLEGFEVLKVLGHVGLQEGRMRVCLGGKSVVAMR